MTNVLLGVIATELLVIVILLVVDRVKLPVIEGDEHDVRATGFTKKEDEEPEKRHIPPEIPDENIEEQILEKMESDDQWAQSGTDTGSQPEKS